jgi:hypothetical protein
MSVNLGFLAILYIKNHTKTLYKINFLHNLMINAQEYVTINVVIMVNTTLKFSID